LSQIKKYTLRFWLFFLCSKNRRKYVQDAQTRCKKWIEQQFDKHKRLLVYQMIAEAAKRFPLEEGEIMRIIAEVLREGIKV
jgi:hypothetical protein